jgi:hypothetical protein
LKKIYKNFSSYEVRYHGVGPNKRDEAFALLRGLLKKAPKPRKRK